MVAKKNKTMAAVKPAARQSSALRRSATVRKRKRTNTGRKRFEVKELWGALPDMGKWAFPLLKEMRDE